MLLNNKNKSFANLHILTESPTFAKYKQSK